MVNCKICDSEFDNLRNLCNHLKHHKITSKDYYDKYLNNGSGVCYCGEPTKFLSITRGYSKYCSRKCMSNDETVREAIKKTTLDRYGYENASSSPLIKQKREDTFLAKYGHKCSLQNVDVRLKTKNTNLLKYGYEYPQQSNIVKEKHKKTMFERYGGFSLSCPIIREKIEETTYDRFGNKNSFCVPEIIDKIKEASIRDNGTPYPNQSDESNKKRRDTNIFKYGYPCSLSSPTIRKKIIDTMISRYGVDNYSKTEEAKELFRNKFIAAIEKMGPYNVRVGNNEVEFIDDIQNVSKYPVLVNNKFFGYFPDGYIEELNLIIEFDEKYHEQQWAIIKDREREAFLINKMGCSFFRVKESEWLTNPEQIKKQFLEVVDEFNR